MMRFMRHVMVSLAVPAVLVASLGAVVTVGSLKLGSQLGDFFEHEDVLATQVNEMYAQGLQLEQALRNVVLDPSNQKGRANFSKAGEAFAQAAQVAQGVATPEQAAELKSLAGLRDRLADVQQQVLTQASDNRDAATAKLVAEETPLWRDLRDGLLKMKIRSAQVKDEQRRSLNASLATARNSVAGLATLSLLLSMGFLFSLRQRVHQELGGIPPRHVRCRSRSPLAT
jgi:small-conductance mechanosensitive channel